MRFRTLLSLRYARLAAASVLLAVGVCVGMGIGYAVWDGGNLPAQVESVFVIRVIDGDTIELIDGRRVRYLGIDTPESGEPFYDEATAKNRQLVEGKVVELCPGHRDRDAYDRLLRYVYADGVFVNAELVAQGYARAYIFDPSERHSQVLVQLEQYAKMREQGLWGQ